MVKLNDLKSDSNGYCWLYQEQHIWFYKLAPFNHEFFSHDSFNYEFAIIWSTIVAIEREQANISPHFWNYNGHGIFIDQSSCFWYNKGHTFVFLLYSLLKPFLVMWVVIRLDLHTYSWIVIGNILNKTILQQEEFDKLFEFMEAVVWVVEVVNWSQRSNHESDLNLFLGKSPVVNCFLFKFL